VDTTHNVHEINRFKGREPDISLLGDIDEPVYMADPETYTVLYANTILKKIFGSDVVGKKCYRVFHDLEKPCPFCTNHLIFGKNEGKTHIWEFFNEKSRRWYHCIDRALTFRGGRKARCEIAIDITEKKEAVERLEERTAELELINSLNEAGNRGDSFESIVEKLAQKIKEMFAANGVALYLLSENKKSLLLHHFSAEPEQIKEIEKRAGMKMPVLSIDLQKDGYYKRILNGGKPVVVGDRTNIAEMMAELTDDPVFVKNISAVLERIGIESMLCIPLQVMYNVVGMLDVTRGFSFTESDVKRCMSISPQLFALLKRKQMEDALRQSEEKFRSLAENSPNMIFINKKGRVIYVNKKCIEIMGYTREEFYASEFDFRNLIARESRAVVEEAFSLQANGIDVPSYEYLLVTKCGEKLDVIITTKLIDFEGGQAIMGIVTDISAQKRAEREKTASRRQLYQAQKMEAVGQLAGGIAHDFNNMLTAINGFADLVASQLGPSHAAYRDIDQIKDVAKRAASLTRQLLIFGRKQAAEYRLADCNTVADNIYQMLRRLLPENISLEVKLEPELWPVRADDGMIEQAIMNLVVNARDAMPDGGSIVITTGNKVIDAVSKKSAVPSEFSGKCVFVSVCDTGKGIAERERNRIFEPFFSTKPERTSSGLGLSVVYGIMEQHNGKIEVESEVDKGSCFTLCFPAAPEENHETGHISTVGEKHHGNGEKILVVEDNGEIRNFTSRSLNENGYVPIVATCMREAVELYERHDGKIDLLFTDVLLPDKSGVTLIERLLEKNLNLRVLCTSGYTDKYSGVLKVYEKRFPFLKKPYDLNKLLSAVSEAMAVGGISDTAPQ
jgi:PAS domain S-box-containing protein